MNAGLLARLGPRAAAAAAAIGILAALPLLLPLWMWLPLIWFVTGGALLVRWIASAADPEDRGILVAALIAGLAARAIMGWFVVDHPYRNSDTRLYWQLGTRLAALWSVPHSMHVDLVRTLGTGQAGYYVWVALHALIAREQLLVVASNCLVSGANGVLTYLVGRRAWSPFVGRVAALLVFTASGIIFSDAHNMRDVIVTFAGLLMVYGVQLLADRWCVKGFLAVVLGIAIAVPVRPYVMAAYGPAVAIGLLVMRRTGRLAVLSVALILAGGAMAYVVSTSMFTTVSEAIGGGFGETVTTLLMIGNAGLTGGRAATSLLYGVQLRTLHDILLYLPVGIVHILFAPLPWKTYHIEWLFVPEGLVRYLLIPFVGIGAWEALKNGSWRRTFIVVFALAGMMLLYAVLELGGNVRHNEQFFPYYFILGAIGIATARRHGIELWVTYAFSSLALWAFGLGMRLSMRFMPLVLLLLGLWWLVTVRPWSQGARGGVT